MKSEARTRRHVSGQQRLEAIEARAAKLKEAARQAKRELEARVNAICGAAWLEQGERDPTFKAFLMEKLRTAPLGARERVEVAHLLIEDESTELTTARASSVRERAEAEVADRAQEAHRVGYPARTP